MMLYGVRERQVSWCPRSNQCFEEPSAGMPHARICGSSGGVIAQGHPITIYSPFVACSIFFREPILFLTTGFLPGRIMTFPPAASIFFCAVAENA